ncbi:hypothetical protein ILUMI_18408 [Ignelater luminosus]|uniref:Copia protein n=1 Tax=Ignelater luminosus TaxID=2038154 RepID=A0A8K0CLD6_IGNLU|nr:hypothetical protein ILUMI_18408 [Ignelater luminosus]
MKTAEKEKKLAQLEKKDRNCKSQIIQRMGDSHLEYAKDKENSYELWSSLCNVFLTQRYIKESLDLGLWFKKDEKESLLCYADADFGSEYDRKSISGLLMKVFGNIVYWVTKTQTLVALSSTKSEYIALAIAVSDLLWLKKLLEDFGISLSIPLKVSEDNQSCIHLLHKWEHRRLKHVDVKYNFVRDLTGKGVVEVKYFCTSEQVADILTKPLSSEQFLKLPLSLGLMQVKGVNTVLEEC